MFQEQGGCGVSVLDERMEIQLQLPQMVRRFHLVRKTLQEENWSVASLGLKILKR